MRRLGLAVMFVMQGCAAADQQQPPDPEFTRLMRVKSQTPSFAGLGSAEGALTVFIFDETKKEEAAAVLTSLFEATQPAIVTRPARGAASEALKDDVSGTLSVPGVSTLDFDETTGYLRVGFSKVSALEAVQANLLENSFSLDLVILDPQNMFVQFEN